MFALLLHKLLTETEPRFFPFSLDAPSTTLIYNIITTHFAGWTVIAIAHKLDDITDFDKVAVLDTGALVEHGNPRELLARRGSVFAGMYYGESNEGGSDGA